MGPTLEAIQRLQQKLQLETPLIALYDAAPSEAFEPLAKLRGRACCFSHYTRWLRGETLVLEGAADPAEKPRHGCPAAQRILGVDSRPFPKDFELALTDGRDGHPGEALKATPELARTHLDRPAPEAKAGHVLLGPLRVEQWAAVKTVTFFVDPDRLAAVMTLASYWSSEKDEVAAPFSSACGMLWRELDTTGRDQAVISCTDIAIRKFLPANILGFTVSAARFEKMVAFPDDTFLDRGWWKSLLDHRRTHGGAPIVEK